MWREDPDDVTRYLVVGINVIDFSYPANQEVVYIVPDNEIISVQAGDIIGWAFRFQTHGVALQYTDNVEGADILRKSDPNLEQDDLAAGDILVYDIYEPEMRDYSIKATVSGEHSLFF